MVLRIEITPVPKPRMTQADRWKKRPCVLRYRAFADEFRSKFDGVLEDPVTIEFILPMPKSWSKKKKKMMDGMPHRQRPDLDNLVKAVQDVVLSEDAHISHYKDIKKTWGKTGLIKIGE